MEDLKQRIRVLHAVGFSAVEEADDSSSLLSPDGGDSGRRPSASSPTRAEGRPGASLEALLLEKNRQLEHALTMARLKVSEASGS